MASGSRATTCVASMGGLLSLCVDGEFFAMRQVGDDDNPNSTMLFMKMQENAFSDPRMLQESTRYHYQFVKNNKAFRLGINICSSGKLCVATHGR